MLVTDSTKGCQFSDQWIQDKLPRDKTILVWNKIDLPTSKPLPNLLPHELSVSALTENGIENLKIKIDNLIWNGNLPNQEQVVLTNIRHKESLSNAIQSLDSIIKGLEESVSPEFLIFEFRQCLQSLGRIIGTDITEDILSAIFSKFCIGK